VVKRDVVLRAMMMRDVIKRPRGLQPGLPSGLASHFHVTLHHVTPYHVTHYHVTISRSKKFP
jgi:hypothetical protein